MFYCEDCRKALEWPESLFKSRGPCEQCGRVAVCNDRQSATLPIPTKGQFDRITWAVERG